MKDFFKSTMLCCGIFIALSLSTLAQGREVTIIFNDGSRKTGELLSVRDSLISVLKSSVENDEEIASHPEIVEIALLKNIDKVMLHELNVKGAGKGERYIKTLRMHNLGYLTI